MSSSPADPPRSFHDARDSDGAVPPVVDAVRAFVVAGVDDPERFDALVRQAHRFQLDHIPALRRLAGRGAEVDLDADGFAAVPLVPAAAFRRANLAPRGLDLSRTPLFRSSGTTGGAAGRSVHRHPFPDLYRATIDAAFPGFCLPSPAPVPMLALVPPPGDLPDSSLSFMVGHCLERFGDPDASAWALRAAPGLEGLDLAAADTWAGERAAEGRPVLVLATAFALLGWLDALEAEGRAHALPPGSAVFETGGFKGRTREIGRDELAARVEALLGVARRRIVREYGMTELTSQLYSRSLAGGAPDLFVAPPQGRVRVLDPITLEERPAGEAGLVAIFDLANLGSALHLLTEDLGRREEGGLRLLGRASEATLRGCSLTAEELTAPG